MNIKPLILTGWGHVDYAGAAAVALRHFKDADIRGISKARLPEALEQAQGVLEIVILGVGLSGNPGWLEKALKIQKQKKTKVVWISAFPLPEEVSPAIRECLEVRVGTDTDSIMAAVGEVYGVSHADLVSILQEKSPKKKGKDEPSARALLQAAMYMHRTGENENAYSNAIRRMAESGGSLVLTEAEKKMIAHYKKFGHRELVGKSASIQRLREQIKKVAPYDSARVLIYGETGTGKETVANLIHNGSPRKEGMMIPFNCASVTPQLLESSFLGHEKGSFTGAHERKEGVFQQADGGTLFLDEIGELPLEAQGILLRVLEGGRFRSVGGKEDVEVNVRIIAATHRNLAQLVRDGRFREDLYYRLNLIQIRVPPLREFKEDIKPIAEDFIWEKTGQKRHITPAQLDALMEYDFPGNVRELLFLLERALVMEITDFKELLDEHKKTSACSPPSECAADSPPDDLKAAIQCHVRRVYEKYGKSLAKATGALGIARNTVTKYLGISDAK